MGLFFQTPVIVFSPRSLRAHPIGPTVRAGVESSRESMQESSRRTPARFALDRQVACPDAALDRRGGEFVDLERVA